MRPKVYLETTIISYLAARPSRDLVVAAHQQITLDWFESEAGRYDLYVSELVAEEAAKGDAAAADRRRVMLGGIAVLEVSEECLRLAGELVKAGCVPRKAGADAVHIAVAAVNQMDYLLTWNCTHINNAVAKNGLVVGCAGLGYRCPTICSPEELTGDPP